MRIIKLMADYECFPLWEASPGVIGNISPYDLPISPHLAEILMSWAKKFDRTLNMNDPVNSGFPSVEEKNKFSEEGKILAYLLQKELGKNYIIITKI